MCSSDEKLKFTRGSLGSDMSAALAALSEFKARTGREWTDEKVRDVHSFHYYPSPLESLSESCVGPNSTVSLWTTARIVMRCSQLCVASTIVDCVGKCSVMPAPPNM